MASQSTTSDPDATLVPAQARPIPLRRREDKLTDVLLLGPEKDEVDIDLAALCRVSSARQEPGFSLDAQRDRIVERIEKDYVQTRGLRVRLHVYQDVNPHDDDDRPMIDQVVRDIPLKGIKHVWVMLLGRFERGGAEKFLVSRARIRDAAEGGVQLNYADMSRDAFEPADDVAELVDLIKVWAAKQEKSSIILQAANGKKGRRDAGLLPGSSDTFGLMWTGDRKSRSKKEVRDYQVPHPVERTTVRWIFELYRDQFRSLRALAIWLTEQGIPGRGGEVKWSSSTLAEMLANEAYIGRGYTNKWETVYDRGKFPSGKKRHRKLPKSQWVLVPDSIRPDEHGEHVVPEELFREVARLRAARDKNVEGRRGGHVEYLLAGGLIRCGYCGTAMAGKTISSGRGAGHRAYTCRCTKSGEPCFVKGGPSLSAPQAEGASWAAFQMLMNERERVVASFDRLRADDGPARERVAELTAGIEQADAVIANVRAMLGGLDASLREMFLEDANKAAADRAAKLAALKIEQGKLAAMAARLDDWQPMLEELAELSEEAHALLGDWPDARKRDLLKRFRVVLWVRKPGDPAGRVTAKAYVTLPAGGGALRAEDADGDALPVSNAMSGTGQPVRERPHRLVGDTVDLDACLAIDLTPSVASHVRSHRRTA